MDPSLRDSEVIRARMRNAVEHFLSHLQRFLNDNGGLIRLPSHLLKVGNSSSEDEDEDDTFQLRKQPKSQAKYVSQIAVAPKSVWRNLHLLFANLDNPNDLETIYLAAVEIPNDPPQSEKIDIKIVARGPREVTNDVDVYDDDDRLPKYIQSDHDSSQSGGNSNGQLPNTSSGNSMMKSRNALLLIATVLATLTFQVPFHNLGRTSEDSSKAGTDGLRQSEFFTSSTFIFFNSIVFVASVVTSLFLLHEFPMKPLPQISISALFGSYMFSIKATSPNEAMPLLLISILFFLLAAAGKLYGFAAQSLIDGSKAPLLKKTDQKP